MDRKLVSGSSMPLPPCGHVLFCSFMNSAVKLAVDIVELPAGMEPPVYDCAFKMPNSSEVADGVVRHSSNSTHAGNPPLLIIEVKVREIGSGISHVSRVAGLKCIPCMPRWREVCQQTNADMVVK